MGFLAVAASPEPELERRLLLAFQCQRLRVGIPFRDRFPEPDALEYEAPQGCAEDLVHRGDQPRLGAPVLAEREAIAGVVRGFKVGEDIRSAEAIDGLLRVANQKEKGNAAREGAAKDRVLDGVRVLEFINEGGPVTGLEVCGQRFATRSRQGVIQARQQVIVILNLALGLAAREFCPREFHEGELEAGQPNLLHLADLLAQDEEAVGRNRLLGFLPPFLLQAAGAEDRKAGQGSERRVALRETDVELVKQPCHGFVIVVWQVAPLHGRTETGFDFVRL